jgi:hypothetical protein
MAGAPGSGGGHGCGSGASGGPPNWEAVFPRTGAGSPGASAEQLMKMRPNYRGVALPSQEPLPTVGDLTNIAQEIGRRSWQ